MKKTIIKSNKQTEKPDLLPIVGIGASAGGLTALKEFFKHVPENSGLAYVVVVHLSPEHKSILAEILQPHLKMQVKQVTQSMALERNHVYVIPPNANLNTIDTHLRLSELEEKRSERAPIDHFLRTLANTHGENSIGIILTGTGSDGTLGIKEIKEKGGLTIAQDPAEAEYDGMPQSAISTGLIDKVLNIKDMPAYLRRFIYTTPRLKFLEPDVEPDEKEQRQIQKIFTQIKARTGRDFSRYKINTLLRRLQRRMQLHQIELLDDYLKLLRKKPEEVQALSDDFLINVTNFFRDASVFNYLKESVIPRLFKNKMPDDQIRIWSVGCATGEEAYSLAILLAEEAARRNTSPSFQVFASDLHEESLKKARNGFFPGDIKVDVSTERRNRFFIKEDGGYRVRKELREMVIFTPHNLMGDPPFSRIDMMVCRNLLIYLKKNVQKDIFELFHYALNPGGFLLLGTSENFGNHELFSVENKEFSVYCRKNVVGPDPSLPVFPRAQSHTPEANGKTHESSNVPFSAMHLRMIERYAPPSLLINVDYQVLHVSENAGRYLKIQGGELSKDVFKLVYKEMQLELRATIHAAHEQKKLVRSKPVYLTIDGEKSEIIIAARWIEEQNHEKVILVMFEEYSYKAPKKNEKKTAEEIDEIHIRQTEELEQEIQDTRQNLQAIIEEYETSREEMKASNEELQSANEELRSTMEELETSKEELQSMNEELTTLNQENRHKVEELSRLSDDLQNLMAATDIATLFLNRELRILRFTPKLGELFNVRPVDVGRPISDQTHKLGYNKLVDDAKKVLKDLQPVQHEVMDKDGKTYFTRVLPYRSAEDRIEGVVITFVDITALKKAEAGLKISEEKYKQLFESIDVGFCIHKLLFDEKQKPVDYQLLDANPAFEKQIGINNINGSKISEIDLNHDESWMTTFARVVKSGKPERFAKEVKFLGNRWHEIYAFRIGNPKDKTVAVLYTDIDVHKKSEAAQKMAKEETERAAKIKEEFLAHMSHEIRTPLNSIIGLSHVLLNENPKSAQLKNLSTLQFAAKNLNLLINDILDYSKIHAGKVPVEKKKFNLINLVGHIQQIHAASADKKGINLKLNIDSKLPEQIISDRLKIEQVLNNLLSNAIKFTREGEVLLHIKVLKKEGKKAWIEFSVTDTGIGVKKEQQENIFDEFCQADPSTVKKYGGTGLGLAISKLYIEMLGSKINLESIFGKGSRFFFELEVGLSREKTEKKKPEEKKPNSFDLSKIKLLIVEDDDFSRMMLAQLLGMWGINFDEAVNGNQAVEMARKNDYDIIFMDVHMPETDGYVATRKIRKMENYKNKPIYALTADITDGIEKEVKNGLFTGKKIKPVNPDEFRSDLIQMIAESKTE